MEWLMDPTAWVGLLTLVILEIVLGIDNLIFIAILAEKLPPSQRDRARLIGLTLALLMRLGLLSVISWIVTLTYPLFSIGSLSFSGRSLILLIGGLFLIFKATVELHERLEGGYLEPSESKIYAGFWSVVTQIVVLDAVFSLDAVITAVGMVDNLGIMMLAVVIAISIMLLASKPLTRFVNAHPNVVVLCLSFLLMIGFSLVAEGFQFAIPKGYLYAAIGFSVTIEFFNQWARRNIIKLEARRPLRERTAEAVLRLLGNRASFQNTPTDAPVKSDAIAFGIEERNMVSGVLSLGERSIRSVMTPRSDMSWINLEDEPETIRRQLIEAPHSFFPVCKGSIDEIIGIARAKDLVEDLVIRGNINQESCLRKPIIVHESINIIKLMETLKRSHGQLVLVADEFGMIQGLVTPIDIFEAIAGEFPDEDETLDIVADGPNRWRVDGAADLHHLEQMLDITGLVSDNDEYASLAGFLLNQFGELPVVNQAIDYEGVRFTILEVEERRIATVLVEHIDESNGLPAS